MITCATSILSEIRMWRYDAEAKSYHPGGHFPAEAAPAVEHPLAITAMTERRLVVHASDSETIEIAIPLPITGELVGIVLWTLRCPPEAKLAVERWTRTEREELGLCQGIYRGMEHFETISPYVKFPRGSGLPGEVWEDRAAKIIARLDQSKSFMRAAGAREQGLRYGLGIPVMNTEHELESVLVVLSTVDFPLALAAETWAPVDASRQLELVQSSYAVGILPPEDITCGYGERLVGRCFASRAPVLLTDPQADFRVAEMFDQGGRCALALPTFNGDRLVSVLSLIV